MDRQDRTQFAGDSTHSGPIRDPFMAAALSMFPGLGQFYNGETAKGFLFVDVGIVNFFVLCLILLTDPIIKTLSAFSKEFHGRPNTELLRSLHQMHFGSTASLVLLFLIIGFVIYSARDAYDSAKGRRLRSIYADSAIQISEAASGSYLFHLASIATCAFLALFLIMPPPPKTNVIVFEFVNNPNVVKPIAPPKTPVIATHSATETASTSTRREVERPKQSISKSPTHAARQQPTETATSHASAKPNKPADQKPTPPALPVVHPVAQEHQQQMPVPTPPKPQMTPGVVNLAPRPTMSAAAPGTAPKPILLAQNIAPLMPVLPMPIGMHSGTAPNMPTPKMSAGSGIGSHGFQPTPSMIGMTSGPSSGSTPVPAPATTGGPRGRSSGDPSITGPAPSRMQGHDGPLSKDSNAVRPVVGGGPNLGHAKPGTDDTETDGGKSRSTGKNSQPGREVDFSAYMAKLQRRIKSHWFPNRITTSNRVQVTFKISLTGELSGLRIERSSGVAAVDQAAMKAVNESAPFPPLPEGAAESQVAEDGRVSIQFTFDYNVFGNDGHGRMLNY